MVAKGRMFDMPAIVILTFCCFYLCETVIPPCDFFDILLIRPTFKQVPRGNFPPSIIRKYMELFTNFPHFLLRLSVRLTI